MLPEQHRTEIGTKRKQARMNLRVAATSGVHTHMLSHTLHEVLEHPWWVLGSVVLVHGGEPLRVEHCIHHAVFYSK